MARMRSNVTRLGGGCFGNYFGDIFIVCDGNRKLWESPRQTRFQRFASFEWGVLVALSITLPGRSTPTLNTQHVSTDGWAILKADLGTSLRKFHPKT